MVLVCRSLRIEFGDSDTVLVFQQRKKVIQMKRLALTLAALVAVSCLAQSAQANGGFSFRQRQRVVVQRQVIVQQRFVQPVYQQQIVQRVYAQPFVQAVYAQPIVQQQCLQQFSQGYSQQLGSGCGQFFRAY